MSVMDDPEAGPEPDDALDPDIRHAPAEADDDEPTTSDAAEQD